MLFKTAGHTLLFNDEVIASFYPDGIVEEVARVLNNPYAESNLRDLLWDVVAPENESHNDGYGVTPDWHQIMNVDHYPHHRHWGSGQCANVACFDTCTVVNAFGPMQHKSHYGATWRDCEGDDLHEPVRCVLREEDGKV